MRGATMAELPKEECVVVKVVTVESAVKEVNIILKDWRPSEKYFNPSSPKIDQHQISPCNISMLYKTGWSWELRTWSHKVNLLDILSTSPPYFRRKLMGAANENSNFDVRV